MAYRHLKPHYYDCNICPLYLQITYSTSKKVSYRRLLDGNLREHKIKKKHWRTKATESNLSCRFAFKKCDVTPGEGVSHPLELCKKTITVETLLTDTLVSGQLYLRPPWQNPFLPGSSYGHYFYVPKVSAYRSFDCNSIMLVCSHRLALEHSAKTKSSAESLRNCSNA